jgi:hypothetical protein
VVSEADPISKLKCADFEIIELSGFVLPKRAGPVARMERRDIRGGGPAFRRCAPPCGLRMFAEIIGFFRLALFCQIASPAAACARPPTLFCVIASEAKQSRPRPEIASLRSQ